MPVPNYPGQQQQQPAGGRYPGQTPGTGTPGYPLAGAQPYPAQSTGYNPTPSYNTPYPAQNPGQYSTTNGKYKCTGYNPTPACNTLYPAQSTGQYSTTNGKCQCTGYNFAIYYERTIF